MGSSIFNCKKLALKELQQTVDDDIRLFICAASYEQRCLSVPLSLDAATIGHVVILKNDDVAGNGNANSEKLINHFSDNSSIVEITKSIAIRTADRISNEILRHDNIKAEGLCVDTTCMTHETLLILLSLFRHIFGKDLRKIRFLYCPAREYDPGTEYEKKWLSQGVKDVRSILGYPGQLMPSRKNRLLVLVGFEVNRAAGLIDVYEPASLGLGYGDGAVSTEHQIINEQKHKTLSAAYPNSDKFKFSSGNPYSVRDFILKDAENHANFNLIVAPMNTKISTIGAALATFINPGIQLCYAAAATYNFDNYSTPDEHFIAFYVAI